MNKGSRKETLYLNPSFSDMHHLHIKPLNPYQRHLRRKVLDLYCLTVHLIDHNLSLTTMKMLVG